MLASFESKLAYDAAKQLQIDRLHAELQQHRSDLISRAIRPFVHGMIELHDSIGKLLVALRARSTDELSPERFFSILEGLQEDVEILLHQNGVSAYREPDVAFDPRRQRVLRKVSTSDKALDGMIAETIRPGFEQGIQILEKERVSIYQFSQSENATPSEVLHGTSTGEVAPPEAQEKES